MCNGCSSLQNKRGSGHYFRKPLLPGSKRSCRRPEVNLYRGNCPERTCIAKTFAGKAGFVASSLFGKFGRCAMRAIWSRAASKEQGPEAEKFTTILEDSLDNLTSILVNAPPRSVTLNYSGKRAIIYIDAYFKLGEPMAKIGNARELTEWQISQISEKYAKTVGALLS